LFTTALSKATIKETGTAGEIPREEDHYSQLQVPHDLEALDKEVTQ